MFGVQWLAISAVMAVPAVAYGDVRPARLTCEYLVNPMGIDVTAPRLAWVLESEERGQRQTAYRVLVAGSEEQLKADVGDLWDSGKVESRDGINVAYAGKPLASGQQAWWKVRVWDKDGKESGWSEVASWEMGLLQPEDWKAKWITDVKPLPDKPEEFYKDDPAPLFRSEFAVTGKVRRARAYASGLGYYEMRCNGYRVGNHALDPGWTSYAKRVLYSTYDVTSLIKGGKNAVGLMVGNGWYNPLPLKMWGWLNLREHLRVGRPMVIMQLDIEYENGTHQMVATGPGWKQADGPILRNSVYLGEVYDARREQAGWDQAGFADGTWRPVVQADSHVGPLRAQMQPPVRITNVLKPIAFRQPEAGVRIFDMGQNFAGVIRIVLNGKSGTRVTFRYGELLDKDGKLNGMTSVAGQAKGKGRGGPGAPDVAYQTDEYILKGGGDEEFSPRFTFHGFRYVEVTGLGEETGMRGLEGLRMNSDVQQVGRFACSSEMFNRIQKMCEWTLLSNLFSVESDCPHREKFGYGGDIMAASEFAMLNFDMAAFYAKVVRDYQDAARDNGALTETAPYVGISDEGLEKGPGPIGWATVHPLLLAQLYQYYGDRRLLEEQYETARRWVEFLKSHAKDDCIEKCIGDHETLAPKEIPLTSTAFYYYNVATVARIAGIIGRADDAKAYSALAEKIREAFNRRFYKAGTARYEPDTQANQAFALYFGMASPDQRAGAIRALVEDVETKHAGHLTTGIFGTKYMLNVLSDVGRADVACNIVSRKDFPGWGHMLEGGATTLWEHWEFSDNTFSHNHPMFGSVSEWFYKAVAGISVADDAVGADKFVIRPNPVGDLTGAEGDYMSARGRVAARWRIEGGKFTLETTIPPGTTATLYLPGSDRAGVRESGQPADQAVGVRFLRAEPGRLVYSLEAGKYVFSAMR